MLRLPPAPGLGTCLTWLQLPPEGRGEGGKGFEGSQPLSAHVLIKYSICLSQTRNEQLVSALVGVRVCECVGVSVFVCVGSA